MKTEFILATTYLNEKDSKPGSVRVEVVEESFDEFIKNTATDTFLGTREPMETNKQLRQIIPYIIVTQLDENDVRKVVCYRRTNKVGEQRLAGNVSVGFGGHIELADVIPFVDVKSTFDLGKVIWNAALRELHEEIVCEFDPAEFVYTSTRDVIAVHLVPANLLLVNDSDEVGQVHLGVVFEMNLPKGITVKTAEDELASMEPRTIEDLFTQKEFPLEKWTEMYLRYKSNL